MIYNVNIRKFLFIMQAAGTPAISWRKWGPACSIGVFLPFSFLYSTRSTTGMANGDTDDHPWGYQMPAIGQRPRLLVPATQGDGEFKDVALEVEEQPGIQGEQRLTKRFQ